MSTIVPMPVRVKPPPADIGRDHLAGLRVLRRDHARERRAHHVVFEADSVEIDRARLDRDFRLERCQARGERRGFGLRGIELVLADEAALPQRAAALVGTLRVRKPHLHFGEVSPRGIEAPAGNVVLRTRRRGFEAREHLSGVDAHAFLDEHLLDLAGDLGGHGGEPARHDVAGRVEHRTGSCAAAGALHRNGFHFHGLRAIEIPEGEARDQRERSRARDPRCARADSIFARRRRALDTQAVECVLVYGHP